MVKTINIDDEIYDSWTNYYEQQNKINYPSLKNFTEKTFLKIIKRKSND